MTFVEKTLSEEYLYRGRVVTLRKDQAELSNGHVVTREVIEHPGGVGIVAPREVIEHPGGVGIVALDASGNLLMVRQLRYPFSAELLEIPAGKLEYGEDPATCGKRELGEETGCVAGRFEPLGCLLPTPAYDNEVIHLYLAQDLTTTRQHLDEDEFLTVEHVPFARALEMVLSGEITDAKTQIGILKLQMLQLRGEL